MQVAAHLYFAYHQNMTAKEDDPDLIISGIAAAIGEPARVRILNCLCDGHARTSTELAVVAEVSPSTASVHLTRLKENHLVKVLAQGRHRYYSLSGPNVNMVLEALNVTAGGSRDKFIPNTPNRLRAARRCYDHIAGTMGVLLHNRFTTMGWLASVEGGTGYDVTVDGAKGFTMLGIDIEAAQTMRRRLAYACLDWSERQPHIGGALGAALLKTVIRRKWVVQDLDSRALSITRLGRREMLAQFGLHL
jgi:DNA-binding transcriptional ArsR family regulator